MTELSLTFPPDLVEAISERAAELVLERLEVERTAPAEASPYWTVPEAAEFLRRPPKYVRDLLSQRRLTAVKVGGEGRGRPTLVLRVEVRALAVPDELPRLNGRPVGSGLAR